MFNFASFKIYHQPFIYKRKFAPLFIKTTCTLGFLWRKFAEYDFCLIIRCLNKVHKFLTFKGGKLLYLKVIAPSVDIRMNLKVYETVSEGDNKLCSAPYPKDAQYMIVPQDVLLHPVADKWTSKGTKLLLRVLIVHSLFWGFSEV